MHTTVPPSASNAAELAALLDVAQEAAFAAADQLERRFRLPPGDLMVKSSPSDIASAADRAAELAVAEVLRTRRPHDAIVAEEGTRRTGSTGVRWVIDPLDGTTNYLLGDPEWSVSIAAHDEHGALVAVVHAPVAGTTYTATRGGGAWCDRQRMAAPDVETLADAIVLLGFSYDGTLRQRQMQEFTSIIGVTRDVRRHGSAALELCRVAAGQAHAYVESLIMTWDVAAGALIAQEAGVRVFVRDLGGERRSIFAATEAVTRPLLAALQARTDAAETYDFVAEQLAGEVAA